MDAVSLWGAHRQPGGDATKVPLQIYTRMDWSTVEMLPPPKDSSEGTAAQSQILNNLGEGDTVINILVVD